MSSELFIVLRHLRYRWKQTLTAILSVAIGVMILTSALSLANGFEKDLVEKILGTTPHVSLRPGIQNDLPNYRVLLLQLARHEAVVSAVPFLKEQALIHNPVYTTGTLVYGVPPAALDANLKKYIAEGALLEKKGQLSLVIGAELARKLQLFLGDQVQLITMKGPTEFKVTGLFRSGLYDLDVRLVLMPLSQAQQLYQTGDIANEIAIKLKDVFKARQVARELQQTFPGLYIRTWMDTNQNLLSAMALEKRVIFLVVLFIIVVAMIGIANTLVMNVMEKTSDIAILRALGGSKRQISQIFLLQGLFIGLIGIAAGCGLGVLTSLFLSYFPIRIPGDIYDLDYIPVDMRLSDFLLVSLAAFVIALLASVFPARRAVRLQPIETLRRQI